MLDVNQLVLWSTPIYTVLIVAEFLMGYFHQHQLYTVKDTLTNIYLTALNMLCDVLFRGIAFGVLLFFMPLTRFYSSELKSFSGVTNESFQTPLLCLVVHY